MLFSLLTWFRAVALVAAAPYSPAEQSTDSGFYDGRSEKGGRWGGRTRAEEQCACDTASIQLPQAPKPLPEVSQGLSLYHIAVGRGTQNYTCDLTNATAVPVAAGAVATLVNATCLTANAATLAWKLPGWAYRDKSAKVPTSFPVNDFLRISGHHYFTDRTTAYFNLDTVGQGRDTWQSDYSQGGFQKVNSTDAPPDAIHGSVPWLKLTSKNASACAFQEVYRVDTVGGAAPKTCAGLDANFQVEYAAEYWFYAKPRTPTQAL